MADKVQLIIGGDSSRAVQALRETQAGLQRLQQSESQTASAATMLANRTDAATTAMRAGRSSAAELAASQLQIRSAAREAAGGVGELNARLAAMGAAREHARQLTAEVDRLGTSLLKIGAVGAAGMAGAVRQFASFDATMAGVQSRVRGSAADMARLREEAIRLGNDPRFAQFSAADVGRGMKVLATGGLSAADISGGAAEAATAAAAAGETDAAQAAQLVIDVMKTFNVAARESIGVVDMLAAAATGSATDFGQLSSALAMGGGAAAAFRRPAQETIGTLALLADHMLRGSDAGTAYKTFLLNLAPATAEQSRAQQQYLGSSQALVNADGGLKSMAEIAGILQSRLGGLGQAQQGVALSTMFGADAFRVAAALMNEGAAGVARYTTMVGREGAASEVARIQNASLAGSFAALKSTVETAAITYGNSLAPAVDSVTKGLTWLTGMMGDADKWSGKLTRGTVTLTTVTALVAGVYLKASAAVTTYKLVHTLLAKETAAATAAQVAETAAVKGATAARTLALGPLAGYAAGLAAVTIAGYKALQWHDRWMRSMLVGKGVQADVAEQMTRLARGPVDALARAFGYLTGNIHLATVGLEGWLAVSARKRTDAATASLWGNVAGSLGRAHERISSAAETGRQLLEIQHMLANVGGAVAGAVGGGGGSRGGGGGSAAAVEQARRRERGSASDLADAAYQAVQGHRVFSRSIQQCTLAVSTLARESGLLTQTYTSTTSLMSALAAHQDRFRALRPGEQIPGGAMVFSPSASANSGWHAMLGLGGGRLAGAPRAGAAFQVQYRGRETLPEGWRGYVPVSAGRGAAATLAEEPGGSAAETVKALSESLAQAAEEQNRQRLEAAQGAGERAVDAAQHQLTLAREQLAIQQVLGAGEQRIAAERQRVSAAQAALWSAQVEAARAVAAAGGDAYEVERRLMAVQVERLSAAREELDRRRQIADEQARQAREAAEEAARQRVESRQTRLEQLQLTEEKLRLQGAGRDVVSQAGQARESAARALAAEQARQGDRNALLRTEVDLLRERDRGGRGDRRLMDAVIGGDAGRIMDILQTGRRGERGSDALTREIADPPTRELEYEIRRGLALRDRKQRQAMLRAITTA